MRPRHVPQIHLTPHPLRRPPRQALLQRALQSTTPRHQPGVFEAVVLIQAVVPGVGLGAKGMMNIIVNVLIILTHVQL